MEISQTQSTRGRILGAATELFRDKGAAGTSVDSLIRSLGIGKSQFYSHFASKSALLEAVLSEQLASLPHFRLGEMNTLQDVVDWVEAILDYAEDGLYLQGCPIINAVGQVPPSDKKLHGLLENAISQWHAGLRVAFQRLTTTGEISGKMTSDGLTALATSAVMGGFTLSKAMQSMVGLEQSLKAFLAFLTRAQDALLPGAKEEKRPKRRAHHSLLMRNCP